MDNRLLVLKRFIDILGSLVGIIVLFPVFIIISLLIKLDSSGPIFFKQQRLGQNGEIFEIIKFRTMISNAEKIGDGLRIKDNNDNRITKVGRNLRNLSLDELPQLFNVLIGHMSLVGPRPPVVYHPYNGFRNYPEWAKKRFIAKPGVTGLSQIKVRNSVSWDERIKIDLIYIEKYTLKLDFEILLHTLIKMFKSENIYN